MDTPTGMADGMMVGTVGGMVAGTAVGTIIGMAAAAGMEDMGAGIIIANRDNDKKF
jgi:hypothetical protein